MKTSNREGSSRNPVGYRGIGIRRSAHNRTLDVTYSMLWPVYPDSALEDLCRELFTGQGEEKNGFEKITSELPGVLDALSTHENVSDLGEGKEKPLERLQSLFKIFGEPRGAEYYGIDFVSIKLFDLDSEPESIEDVYFRLHLISSRWQLPHSVNLNGVFGLLPTLVWTTQGPVLPEDFPDFRDRALWGHHPPLLVTHVDKFPYLVNYLIPEGVRVADAARVRLGAYLGEGTTIMPAGYVNFNAGTKGAAMVEGRISAGVVVGEHSDVGGGASIMGTLSGGNRHVIEIGAKCLLGANAGTGISLGFGCTIAAGTYVTAASKVFLYDRDMQPVDLLGNQVSAGSNICKALELSGRNHLLFYLDSARGQLVCRPNRKTIDLNPQLHAGVVD